MLSIELLISCLRPGCRSSLRYSVRLRLASITDIHISDKMWWWLPCERSLSQNHRINIGIFSPAFCTLPRFLLFPRLVWSHTTSSLPHTALTPMSKHFCSSSICSICLPYPHHAQLSAVLLYPYKSRVRLVRTHRLPSSRSRRWLCRPGRWWVLARSWNISTNYRRSILGQTMGLGSGVAERRGVDRWRLSRCCWCEWWEWHWISSLQVMSSINNFGCVEIICLKS